MDEELEKLLRRSRARHQRAVKLSAIVVAAGFVVHVTLYSRFVDTERRFMECRRDLAKLQRTTEILYEIDLTGILVARTEEDVNIDYRGGRARQLPAIEEAISSVFSKGLMANIKADFGRLQKQIDLALTDDPEPEETNAAQESGDRVEPLDEKLAAEIRIASNRDKTREILRTHVDETIVEPRFDDANRVWRKLAPEYEAALENALMAIKRAKTQLGSSYEEMQTNSNIGRIDWDGLESAIQSTQVAIGQLEVKPPEESNWWYTTDEKDRTGMLLAYDATEHIETDIDIETRLRDVRESLEATTAWYAQAEMRMQRERYANDEAFQRLQETVGSIDQTLKIVFLDLDSFVRAFPCLIGLLVAIGLCWPAYSWRDMRGNIAVACQKDEEASIWKEAFGYSDPDFRQLRWSTVIWCSAGCIWVLVGSLQLAYTGAMSTLAVIATFSVGATLVAGAGIRRMTLMRYQMTQD